MQALGSVWSTGLCQSSKYEAHISNFIHPASAGRRFNSLAQQNEEEAADLPACRTAGSRTDGVRCILEGCF